MPGTPPYIPPDGTAEDAVIAAMSAAVNSSLQFDDPDVASAAKRRGEKIAWDRALQAALKKLGIDEGDVSVADYDEMIAQLRAMGVDVDDPDVLAALEDPGITLSWKNRPQDFSRFALGLQQAFPAQDLTSYQQAQAAYRVEDIQTAFDTPEGVSFGEAGPYSIFGHEFDVNLPPATPGKGTDYEVQQDTGAYVYRNGVIADPNTGELFYPAGTDSAKVTGSAAWLLNAQTTWTPEQIKAQKSKLVQFGYLAKGSLKGTGWTLLLESALKRFYDDRYLHGGIPSVLDPELGGFGSGGTEGGTFVNLRQIHGAIQQDVRSQYLAMFGEEPTQPELSRWVEFVVRTGNKLQRLNSAAPSAAGSEASARMGNAMQSTPAGQFAQDQQENTELRDSFIAAAQAGRAISTGY